MSLKQLQDQYQDIFKRYALSSKSDQKKLMAEALQLGKQIERASQLAHKKRNPVQQAAVAKKNFNQVIRSLNARVFQIAYWEPAQRVAKVLGPGKYSFSATLITKKDGEPARRRKIARLDFTGGSVNDYLMDIHQLYYRSAVSISLEDIAFRPVAPIKENQVRARDVYALKMSGIGSADYKPHPGQCFIDFVLVRALDAKIRLTRPEIIEALGGQMFVLMGVTQEQSILFAEKMNFTIRNFDPFLRLSGSYIAKNPKLILNIIWNNNHCYGILDPQVNRSAVSKLELGLKPETDYTNAVEWRISAAYIWDDYEALRKMDLKNPAGKTVLVDCTDLSFLARVVIEQTHTIINQLELSANGRLIKFLHPNGSLVVAAPDLEERRRVLETLEKKTSYLGFKFANQSWSIIGRLSAEFQIGNWRESHYPPVLLEILEKIDIAPAVYRLRSEQARRNVGDADDYTGFPYKATDLSGAPESIDFIRQYTSILMNMKEPYPIFNCWDEYTDKEPYAGYAEIAFVLNGKNYQKNFWPLSMLKDLRSIGIPVQIFRYLKASHWLEPKHLAEWAQTVHQQFPKESKNIVNHFIGLLGRKYDRFSKMALTTSIEIADAMTNKYPNLNFYDTMGVYFMKQTDQVLKHRGHLPIWHQVIASSLINLHKMTEAVRQPSSIILGYNTDSVKIINPKEFPRGIKVGEFRKERYKPAYGELKDGALGADAIVPDWQPGLGLIAGPPGSGKTRLLCENSDKESLVMGWTCRSVENINTNPDNKNKIKAETLDHRFYKMKPGTRVFRNAVRIDEFSMVPLEHLINLWDQKCRFGGEIQMYGDDNQCLTLKGDGVDYLTSGLVKWLVGNKLTQLPYLPETGRYDAQTHKVLEVLLKEKTLNVEKKEFPKPILTLCATHQKRFDLNFMAFQNWAPKGAKYGDWFVGCPIISYQNFGPVKNSHFFTIVSVTPAVLKRSDGVIIELDSIKAEQFRYGWAETIRRWQGGKITHPYNITELDKMDLRDIYTAIGRTTKWEHVGFDGSQVWAFEKAAKWLPYGALEPRIMYEDQYLYSLGDYIGRTNDPVRRAEQHKEAGREGDMKLTHYYKATTAQIDKLETQEISLALKSGVKLTNKKKTKVLKPKTEFRVAILQTRFTPTDQPDKKRYRIIYNDAGKRNEERFSYIEMPKKEAELLALMRQKELTNKFGL